MKALLLALLAFAALACSCEHFKNEPWNGKLYVGDPERAAVVRSQDDEVVKATDPAFGNMVCMSAPDFRDLLDKYRGYRANCPAPAVESAPFASVPDQPEPAPAKPEHAATEPKYPPDYVPDGGDQAPAAEGPPQ